MSVLDALATIPIDAVEIECNPDAELQVESAPTFASLTFDQMKTTLPSTMTQNFDPSGPRSACAPPAIGTAWSVSAESSEYTTKPSFVTPRIDRLSPA